MYDEQKVQNAQIFLSFQPFECLAIDLRLAFEIDSDVFVTDRMLKVLTNFIHCTTHASLWTQTCGEISKKTSSERYRM